MIWRRAALLLVGCAALAAIASSSAIHGALLELLSAAEEVISQRPLLGAVVFMLFAAFSAMFTFVSIAIVAPAAVFAWGEPATALLLWCGWMLGGVFTYGVGRFLGRAVVRWLTANEALARIERRIDRDAPFWLVLLLQLALPSEITGYLLGLVAYRPGAYLLALAIAELPYTLATVYLGANFVAGHGGRILAFGVAAVALSITALYVLRRALTDRSTARAAPDGVTSTARRA